MTRQYVIDNGRLEDFSVDAQLRNKFTTGPVDHTLPTGVSFMRVRSDIDSQFGYADSVAPSDTYNLNHNDFDFDAHPNPSSLYCVLLKQKQTDLRAQDQVQWDRALATLGGRYGWADQSSFNRDYGNKSERDDREFTWHDDVNYLFDDGVTPYFSYSESSELASQTDTDGDPLVPSGSKRYKVGVKYMSENRPIVVTDALYQLTETNNPTADPNGLLFSTEDGEIHARGVELGAEAALSVNVDVIGSYTYTDVEYTTDTTYKDSTPAQVPKHTASLWADCTFSDGPLSSLTLGTDGCYTGSNYDDPVNSFKAGGYTVMDALVCYDLTRVGVAGSNMTLHVNNLFDREYVASCLNAYGCSRGTERQVIVTAAFRF